jgi:uncharacterized protein YijF (DUF1287 family)
MISADMILGLLFLFNDHTNRVNQNLISFDQSNLLQGAKKRTEAVLFNNPAYKFLFYPFNLAKQYETVGICSILTESPDVNILNGNN